MFLTLILAATVGPHAPVMAPPVTTMALPMPMPIERPVERGRSTVQAQAAPQAIPGHPSTPIYYYPTIGYPIGYYPFAPVMPGQALACASYYENPNVLLPPSWCSYYGAPCCGGSPLMPSLAPSQGLSPLSSLF
jgi:hypothetical protein